MAHPFAYDPQGAILASADGMELIGSQGETEAPVFRFVHDALFLSLQVGGGALWALDSKGNVLFIGFDGALLGQASLGAGVLDLSPVRQGRSAALTAGGATVISREGMASRVIHPGATAATLDPAGQQVLVGDGSGALTVYDTTGAKRGQLALDGSIAALASAPGCWFAAVGPKIVLIDEKLQGSDLLVTVSGETVEYLATEDTQRLVMARLKGNRVIALNSWRDKLMSARYLDKAVGQVAFGPLPWIGVGLDGGDGNKFNLRGGGTHRTDTHPEREHHSWMLSVSVDDGAGKAIERSPAPIRTVAPPPPSNQVVPAPKPAAAPARGGLTAPPAAGVAKKGPPRLVMALVALFVVLPAVTCVLLAILGALFGKH